MDVPIDSLDTSASVASKGKRKASVLDMPEDRPSKPRTLGGDRPRETIPVREITSTSLVSARPHLFEGAALLPVPPLLTFLSANVEGSDCVFEARNSDGDGW
jgi:protein HIRA/HIR1